MQCNTWTKKFKKLIPNVLDLGAIKTQDNNNYYLRPVFISSAFELFY